MGRVINARPKLANNKFQKSVRIIFNAFGIISYLRSEN